MRILVTIPPKPTRQVATYTGPLSLPRAIFESEPGTEWALEDLQVPRLPVDYGATAPVPTSPQDLLKLGSTALFELANTFQRYANAAAALESGRATQRDGSVLALLIERLEKEDHHPPADVELAPDLLASLAEDET